MKPTPIQPKKILSSGEWFTIDVDAEIRKLATRRLKSPGESALELVRFVAGLLAKRIDIDLQRRRLRIRCHGGQFDGKLATALSTAMDTGMDSKTRHDALVRLEDLGGLALLGAFVDHPSRIQFEWSVDGQRNGLCFKSGKPAVPCRPTSNAHFQIVIEGRRKDYLLEKSMVRNCCRFAPIPITLGRRRIDRGPHLDDPIVSRRINAGNVTGWVGVPTNGDLVNGVTLQSGIVLRQWVLSFPNGFALDAVIEGHLSSTRELSRMLQECGNGLYGELKSRFNSFDSSTKTRVKDLLLEHSLQTKNTTPISGLPIFANVNRGALSFEAVKKLAADGSLFAIDERDAPETFETHLGTTLLLSETARRFIEMFLDAPIPAPPSKAQHRGYKRRVSAIWRDGFDAILRSFPTKRGRPVEPRFLAPLEHSLREALANHLADVRPEDDLVLTDHQRSLVAFASNPDGGCTYYLSRSHPRFRIMLDTFASTPQAAHPCLWLVMK